MTTFDFERDEEIASAMVEAVKIYAPPAGLQDAIRERLFGKIRDLASPPNAYPAGAMSVKSQVANAATWPRGRTAGRVARYAGGLAIIASLLAMLSIWGSHGDPSTSLAFADVQEAIRHVQTAIEVYDSPQQPWMNCRSLYRSDCSVVRTEWPNGIVGLRDTNRGQRLMLNPKNKTARTEDVTRGLGSMHIPGQFATPREFLDTLAGIEQIAVSRLEDREFDGRKLVGFVLPRDKFAKTIHMLCHLWVDPQTRLPVHYEFLPEDPGHLPASFRHSTLTFTFNRPLDASLFRLVPPEDYTVLHEGLEIPYLNQLPLPPKDEKLASPVIEPGFGIGPARFGMSLEQVIKVVGPPDDASDWWEPTPAERREIDETHQRACKEADKKGLKGPEKIQFVNAAANSLNITQRAPNGMSLDYISRGFVITVLKDRGLIRIFCYGENAGMRPFTGKTSKGIGIGATIQEIEHSYGPPSIKSEQPIGGHAAAGLYYKSLNMIFDLRDGRLWELSLDKP